MKWRVLEVPAKNDGAFEEMSKSLDPGKELRDNLEEGERLAIFGCAQYTGWKCFGKDATLEILLPPKPK